MCIKKKKKKPKIKEANCIFAKIIEEIMCIGRISKKRIPRRRLENATFEVYEVNTRGTIRRNRLSKVEWRER